MKITGKLKTDTPRPTPKPIARPPSRTARMLALAYYIERKIDAGEIESYADAARRLSISRARVSQVMALRTLAIPTLRKKQVPYRSPPLCASVAITSRKFALFLSTDELCQTPRLTHAESGKSQSQEGYKN